MLVSISWLRKYVPISLTSEELAHRLTMAGTEVSGVHEIGKHWERDKIIVGEIVDLRPHPNADRLMLPTVHLGTNEAITVVCGAPNVAKGQKVAFAREGAKLFNPKTGEIEGLEPAKIRGVMSNGMVCSSIELGLSGAVNHDEIIVLDSTALAGVPLVEYLGDTIFDIDVTPNRPDCLSILGVSREIGAVTGESVTEPQISYVEEGLPIDNQVRIVVSEPGLCHRYTATIVRGVKVGPSPWWLRDALGRLGHRSINNIVDITNYVMLEYGQPLHAFDFDMINGETIIVRSAKPGERLTTLDEETRILKDSILTISDGEDAVALAGVIGGAETAVDEKTVSVLLESANFDSSTIRRTSTELRLKTEASYRFERGIRSELAPLALKRATQLVVEIAGGKAARGIADVCPSPKEVPVIPMTRRRMKQVLGIDFGDDVILRVLDSLGFDCVGSVEDGLLIRAPYWRSDIAIEEDLIEEVARIVGYDKIPTTMLSTPMPSRKPNPNRDVRECMRESLVSCGMQEIVSYPLTSLSILDAVGALSSGFNPIRVSNPISSEAEYLRTSLRGSLLQIVHSNLSVSRGESVRIFEIGKVYLSRGVIADQGLPNEKEMLVGIAVGPRFHTSWLVQDDVMNFFDAKGLLDATLSQINIAAHYDESKDPFLHPGRGAQLTVSNRVIGVVGEVHHEVLEAFDLVGSDVSLFELDLEELYAASFNLSGGYVRPSRFPGAERDLAVIVDTSVSSGRVKAIIECSDLVRSSIPFDVYVGEEILCGKKSIAFKTVFQSPTKTLTAEQVDEAQAEIFRQLRCEVGGELRQ